MRALAIPMTLLAAPATYIRSTHIGVGEVGVGVERLCLSNVWLRLGVRLRWCVNLGHYLSVGLLNRNRCLLRLLGIHLLRSRRSIVVPCVLLIGRGVRSVSRAPSALLRGCSVECVGGVGEGLLSELAKLLSILHSFRQSGGIQSINTRCVGIYLYQSQMAIHITTNVCF